MNRKNYFLLLGLDPDKATTWAVIEPQLKEKRNEWSKPHPTRKLEFQEYRCLLPDMEAVLKNDETRRNEAAEARKIVAEERTKALADLDDTLGVMAKKGHLVPGDIAEFVARSGNQWTESAVRARAIAIGLEIKHVVARIVDDGVDVVTWAKIAKALDIVGKKDLYELLEHPRTTSTETLYNEADASYQRVRTHGDKSKPEFNARQELYGYCLILFSSDAERAKYDYSLDRVRFAEIERLAIAAGSGERRIDYRVLDELIKRGVREGIRRDEVIECVQRISTNRGWLLDRGQPVTDQRELCNFCQTLGAVNETVCARCGTPLRLICPKCGDNNSSCQHNCTKCGFAIAEMWQAERCLKSSKAIAQSDLPRAVRDVEQALTYWPGHPQAIEWKATLEVKMLEKRKRRQRNPRWLEMYQSKRPKALVTGLLPFLFAITTTAIVCYVVFNGARNESDTSAQTTLQVIHDVKLDFITLDSLVFTVSTKYLDGKKPKVEVCVSGEDTWRESRLFYTSIDRKMGSQNVLLTCRLEWDCPPKSGMPIRFRVVYDGGIASAIHTTRL
jgi:hypothetical protein